MITIEDELDLLFDCVDRLYEKEGLNTIDLVLSQARPEMGLDLLLGFLTITLPHKEQFVYRQRIIEMVREIDDRPGLLTGLV